MASGAGQVDDDGCCCCLHASYSCVILIKSWDVCSRQESHIRVHVSILGAAAPLQSVALLLLFKWHQHNAHKHNVVSCTDIYSRHEAALEYKGNGSSAVNALPEREKERCVYYLDAHLYRRCTAARWYCTVHTQPTSQGQCTKESKMLFSDSSVRSYDFPSRTPGRGRAVVRCSTRFAPYFQGANSSSV